jgi:hypothetical protein
MKQWKIGSHEKKYFIPLKCTLVYLCEFFSVFHVLNSMVEDSSAYEQLGS